jgi:hypothetical protein
LSVRSAVDNLFWRNFPPLRFALVLFQLVSLRSKPLYANSATSAMASPGGTKECSPVRKHWEKLGAKRLASRGLAIR